MINLYEYLSNPTHLKQIFLKSIRVFHKLFLVLLLLLACSNYSYGAVSAGYSDYYIPGDEVSMWTIFNALDNAGANTTMHTVISVTAWSDNTIVYYDHWENGYGFDPANPAATADERIVLVNTGDQQTFESSNIPTAPRGTNQYYDGGDRIYVAGGAVTVTRSSWIEAVGVGNQSAAWEIYPVKPQLTTYVLPFGENLGYADFNRVFVLVQATADNTTFTVDLDGNGTLDTMDWTRDGTGDGTTVTLDRGETFLLDRVSAMRPTGDISSGTVIQGNATLQVKFVAGNPGQNYCARGLSAFPRGFWTNDYYAPLDDPTNGNTDYYLYNPHASSLTVNWESLTSSGSFSIPAGSTVSYRTAVGTVPADSGLYFKADDTFWGVGINNAGANAYEWGFSLLPSTFLYQEHFLGWAPGSIALDPTGNPGDQNDDGVFLIAAQDNTRVFVDFDNDGVADQIDTDQNGTPDSWYVTLNRLQTQFFYDPNDGDMSKAHFWATGAFTMAYGENSDGASTSTPSLDLGYVAIPGSDFISLVLTVDKSVDSEVVPTASGSQAIFTLKVNSQKYSLDSVSVTDYLPANWDFVNDSAVITLPDMSTVSGAAANPTKTGAGPYTLDWPNTLLGNMAENQEITITYTAQTTTALAAGTLSQNRMKAAGTRIAGSETQTFTATDFVYVVSGEMTVAKTSSATDPLFPGNEFTYTITATNPATATTNLTGISIFDPLPAGVSYVAGSGSVSCIVSVGNKTVLDNFGAIAYNNNDGTTDWATSWMETDSMGGGAASGLARVTGGALQLRQAVNVRDEFGSQAYNLNTGTENWSDNWTETDIQGLVAGATAGFVWVSNVNNSLQFRYLASTYIDNFTTNVYTRNDGTNIWTGPWTETGDDGTAAGGVITVDAANNNRVNFGPGTVGRAITRTAAVTGDSVNISFVLSDQGIDAGEGVIASYDLGLGAGFQEIQRITNNTLAPAVPVMPINTAGATSITLQFLSFDTVNGTYEGGDNAGVDTVNITVNDAVGSQIQRTADLTGATSASLNFTYAQANLDIGGDFLVLEASTDPTGPFTTLATFNAGVPDVAPPYDLTPYISATTTIRFRVTSGFNVNLETLSIDNIDITSNYAAFTAVQRTANLTGAVNPMLSFTSTPAGLAAGDTLVLEASTSPTGTFTTLATSNGGALVPASPYNLTPYISATTTIRFRITGGYNAITKTFSIDAVQITNLPLDTIAADPPDLLSNSAGCYISPNSSLTATYNVIVDNPLAAGIEEITNTAYVNSNEIILPLSASVTNLVVNPTSGSAEVGDRVWLDSDGDGVLDVGEPGLANVEVTLKDEFGTPLMTTTTDATGHYLFTGVTPGNNYYVEATSSTIPTGLTQSAPAGRTDNRTAAFNLTAGESYITADLGYTSDPSTAVIGHLVWSDFNSNGLRDAGEAGLAGVTVELWQDTNSNGLLEPATDTLVTSTTTAADGSYLFTGVTASGTEDYLVYVNETQAQLTGYTRTTPIVFSILDVNAGDAILSANFGFNSATTYSIKDRVWFDANGDGSQSGALETGIALVTVDLLDASLNAIATTTTDANGDFTFTGIIGSSADYTINITDTSGNLANYYGTTASAITGTHQLNNLVANVDRTSYPGTVAVTNGSTAVVGTGTTFTNYLAGEQITIAGVAYTIQSITDNTNLNLTTNYAGATASGLAYSTLDFGYGLNSSIGSKVYNDINNNGVQDSGDNGFSGITVKLYSDAGVLGVIDGSDAVVATLTTDSNGNYLFSGLSDGNYIVSIETPPASYTYLGTDSDSGTTGQQQAASISGGSTALDKDFRYQAPTPRSASGTIWKDTDADGVIDGTETRLSGVTLDLLQGSTVIATTTTASDGSYSFSGLVSDTYTVKVTDNAGVLSGYVATYEKTGGTGGPFDGQESVDLTSGDQIGVDFGYNIPVPTLVVLSDFRAYNEDRKVRVQWTTSSEIDTAGFFLYRLEESTGKYKQINRSLLPALLNSHQGGTYSLIDNGASLEKGNTYVLVEIEGKGARNSYGPFNVIAGGSNAVESHYTYSAKAAGAFLNSIDRPAEHQINKTTKYVDSEGTVVITNSGGKSSSVHENPVTDEVSDYKMTPKAVSAEKEMRTSLRQETKAQGRFLKDQRHGGMVKIAIEKDGLYYISSSEISRLNGMSQDKVIQLIKTARIALNNQGNDVAYLPTEDYSGIYFYGQGTDSIYTKENIYWLYKGRGSYMGYTTGEGPVFVEGMTFSDTVHAEQDKTLGATSFMDPEADFWFWDQIVGGWKGYDTKTFTIETKGAVGPPYTATLTTNLQGFTETPADPDHHVRVSVNGTVIGNDFWNGTEKRSSSFQFSQSLLYDGPNTIQVKGLLDKGVPWSLFYIDSFDLTYQRLYETVDNTLLLRGEANPTVTVQGFTGPDILVFDVTNPLRPVLNTATAVDPYDGNYSASFVPSSPQSVYLAISTDAAVEVTDAWADSPSNLTSRNNWADYILIAPEELIAGAQELADYRRKKDLRPMVVNVEDIMDEFNYGLSSPKAIQAFLTYAYNNWIMPPKYVVLVGDGTYDYRDNLHYSEDLVPTMVVRTPDGLFTSDNILADVNADHVPEIAIGRLPVISPEELHNVTAKIIAYERNAGNHILMLADNADAGGDFPGDSGDLAALIPPATYQVNKIYLSRYSITDARQMLFSEINSGTSLINYMGHASSDNLAAENLLKISDVASLSNIGKPFVLSAMTCLAGQYAYPGADSLSETLLLKENAGATAVWAPSGLAFNSDSKLVTENFLMTALKKRRMVLGSSILNSLKSFYSQGGPTYVLDIYNLLGDPALRLW